MSFEKIEVKILDVEIVPGPPHYLTYRARLVSGRERSFDVLYYSDANISSSSRHSITFPSSSNELRKVVELPDRPTTRGKLQITYIPPRRRHIMDAMSIDVPLGGRVGRADDGAKADNAVDAESDAGIYPDNGCYRMDGDDLYFRVEYTDAVGSVTGYLNIYQGFITHDGFPPPVDYPNGDGSGYVEFNCGPGPATISGTYDFILSDNNGDAPARPNPPGTWLPPSC